MTAKIAVSIRLDVEPAAAFELFTRDVDRWWQKGQRYRFRGDKSGTMRFEPGEGGRLVEIYDEAAGELFEIGRISIWRPGERLTFLWRLPNFQPGQTTEVDITFTAVQGGTRLMLEHHGWNSLPPDHPARHGLEDRRFLLQRARWWDDQLAAMRPFPFGDEKLSNHDDLRRIALSMPGAYEEPHFGSPSFRVAKKIFITTAPELNRATLKLDPDHQEMLFDVRPEAFLPLRLGQDRTDFRPARPSRRRGACGAGQAVLGAGSRQSRSRRWSNARPPSLRSRARPSRPRWTVPANAALEQHALDIFETGARTSHSCRATRPSGSISR